MGEGGARPPAVAVTEAIETSVVVRYLVRDDPEQGRAAADLIDGGTDLQISLVALVESAFVLAHHYQVPREEIVDSLVALLRRRNIRVLGADAAAVAAALLLCRPSGRVSFADALLRVDALAHGVQKVWSIDRRFPTGGLEAQFPLRRSGGGTRARPNR